MEFYAIRHMCHVCDVDHTRQSFFVAQTDVDKTRNYFRIIHSFLEDALNCNLQQQVLEKKVGL